MLGVEEAEAVSSKPLDLEILVVEELEVEVVDSGFQEVPEEEPIYQQGTEKYIGDRQSRKRADAGQGPL